MCVCILDLCVHDASSVITGSAGHTPVGTPSLPSRYSKQTGAKGAVAYLLDSYERAALEERHIGKRGGPSSEHKPLLTVAKECCVSHTALLLMGYLDPPSNSPQQGEKS